MTVLKKVSLFVAICLALFVFQKPITAAAEAASSYINSLQGNWGSSGAHAPRLPYSPNDNPEYTCQWQIYTDQTFTNNEKRNFIKVSWASFTMDKNKTFYSSKGLKWKVAHVIQQEFNEEPLPRAELIDSNTKETSLVQELLEQYVSVGFNPTVLENANFQYEVETTISLTQQVESLVVSNSNSESVGRDRDYFENRARINVKRAPNVRSSSPLYPLVSQLVCEKTN